MGKFRSVYNSTAGEADEIKAFLHASQALVSTTGSLHVLLQNSSIAVTATDLDIRDLTQADEITVFQGTSPWVVSATDLDIRDLSSATDSVSITDGGGSITVDAANLDIRDLVFATDKVDVSGSSVTTTMAAPSNFDVLSKAVTTTGAALYTSPSGQVKVHIQNAGNQDIAIGNSGVTFTGTPATDGYIVSPGSEVVIDLSDAAAIHAVAKAGTQDVRVLALIA